MAIDAVLLHRAGLLLKRVETKGRADHRLWAQSKRGFETQATLVLVPDEDVIPETRFTALGDDRIAYQGFGEGDSNLQMVSTFGDGIDTCWYWPAYAALLRRR